jgi:ribosomal-protein-alanine N-acetyltransferase
MSKPRLRIRPMQDEDLRWVVEVESRGHVFPWTRSIFADCLRVGYGCLVLEQEDTVVAHLVMASGAGQAHILNLCVDPEWQGRGYGGGFLDHALERLRISGIETVFLEVRPSNDAAIALYESRGFNEVGRRRDYYPAAKGREDALVFARQIL